VSLLFKDLGRRRRRALLNLVGLVLGAAAYMVLVAAANGALAQLRQAASMLGAELVVQRTGSTSPWASMLRPEQVEPLSGIQGVRAVTPVALGKTRFLGAGYFLVFGFDPVSLGVSAFGSLEGRLPEPGASEAMIGALAAERFELAVGDRFAAGRSEFTVAAVYRTGRSLLDSGAVLDVATVQRLFNLDQAVNMALLQLDPDASATQIQTAVSAEDPGLEALPTSEWVDAYGQVALIQRFIRLVALVALGIAVLGVSNVLHIDVAERTRELAVLRAIGWSRWRVARVILAQGVALSLTAGVLAAPVATLILHLADTLDPTTFHAAGFLPTGVPWPTVLEGILVTLAAGLIGSLAPLIRALRLDPASALREWF